MNEDVYDIQEGAYQIITWQTYVTPDGDNYIELKMIGKSGKTYVVTATIDFIDTIKSKLGKNDKPIKKEGENEPTN